jgi:hypothetical protein
LVAFLRSKDFLQAEVEETRPTVEDTFMARMGAPEA